MSLRDLKWWFLHRFHPKHRYHIIKTGLEPGWHDRDLLMAVLIKKLVVDFVELEKPYNWFDTENSPNKQEWIELRALYDWFKKTDLVELDFDEYEEINERLIWAIKLRKMLWT